MKTAVIYARVSTQRQAAEQLPIQSQLDQCLKKADELGADVIQTYIDDGLSGRVDSRPAFQEAVQYCELAGPDYFITWSTSRFARNKVDAGMYKLRLARAGTNLVFCNLIIDRDSDAGWMTEGVLELFDEFYSRQISADTTRSMVRNAQQGHWNGGRTPYGYQAAPAADGRRRQLVPRETEADLVRRIFALRMDGLGAKAIAQDLNTESHTNRGRLWRKQAVLGLLRNPAVIGQTVFGRRPHTGAGDRRRVSQERWIIVESHEPIIDRAQWDAVQVLLDEATNPRESGSPHSGHLWTGLLECGRCGSSLQIETAKGRGRRYSYYGCRARQKHGDCNQRRIPADGLDEWLLSVVCRDILSPENLQGVVMDLLHLVEAKRRDQSKARRALADDIERLRAANGKLYEVLELMGREAPNLSELGARIRENQLQIRQCERRLVELDNQEPESLAVDHYTVRDLAEALETILKTSDNPRKIRGFLGTFIDRIVVGEDTVEVKYMPERLVRQPAVAGCGSQQGRKGKGWLPGPPLLGTLTLTAKLPDRYRARRP